MTNRELSQAIRKDLKEHGITSKDVSVRVRDAIFLQIDLKNILCQMKCTRMICFVHQYSIWIMVNGYVYWSAECHFNSYGCTPATGKGVYN